MPIILEKLRVSLGSKTILYDLSFSFAQGLTYLIGQNGSGKTTLLHSIAQLLPYSGRVLLDDKKLSTFSRNEVARQFALVRQQNLPQFSMKVFDFVLLGRFPYLNWLGTFGKEDVSHVQESLKRLEITHLADKSITKLSGGEWQKVLIARALAQATPIILMDEPAQSLDPKNKQELYALLLQMSKNGKNIICTTHDLEALKEKDAYFLALKNGAIIWEGEAGLEPQEVLEKVY